MPLTKVRAGDVVKLANRVQEGDTFVVIGPKDCIGLYDHDVSLSRIVGDGILEPWHSWRECDLIIIKRKVTVKTCL